MCTLSPPPADRDARGRRARSLLPGRRQHGPEGDGEEGEDELGAGPERPLLPHGRQGERKPRGFSWRASTRQLYAFVLLFCMHFCTAWHGYLLSISEMLETPPAGCRWCALQIDQRLQTAVAGGRKKKPNLKVTDT